MQYALFDIFYVPKRFLKYCGRYRKGGIQSLSSWQSLGNQKQGNGKKLNSTKGHKRLICVISPLSTSHETLFKFCIYIHLKVALWKMMINYADILLRTIFFDLKKNTLSFKIPLALQKSCKGSTEDSRGPIPLFSPMLSFSTTIHISKWRI